MVGSMVQQCGDTILNLRRGEALREKMKCDEERRICVPVGKVKADVVAAFDGALSTYWVGDRMGNCRHVESFARQVRAFADKGISMPSEEASMASEGIFGSSEGGE